MITHHFYNGKLSQPLCKYPRNKNSYMIIMAGPVDSPSPMRDCTGEIELAKVCIFNTLYADTGSTNTPPPTGLPFGMLAGCFPSLATLLPHCTVSDHLMYGLADSPLDSNNPLYPLYCSLVLSHAGFISPFKKDGIELRPWTKTKEGHQKTNPPKRTEGLLHDGPDNPRTYSATNDTNPEKQSTEILRKKVTLVFSNISQLLHLTPRNGFTRKHGNRGIPALK